MSEDIGWGSSTCVVIIAPLLGRTADSAARAYRATPINRNKVSTALSLVNQTLESVAVRG